MTFEQKILRFSVVLIIFVAANTLVMTVLLKEQLDPLKLRRSWLKLDEELYPDEKVQITWAKTKIRSGQIITPDMVESGDVRYSRVERFGRLPLSHEIIYSISKRDLNSGVIVQTEDITVNRDRQAAPQQPSKLPQVIIPAKQIEPDTASPDKLRTKEEEIQGPVKPKIIPAPSSLPAEHQAAPAIKNNKTQPPLKESQQVPQQQTKQHTDKSSKRQSQKPGNTDVSSN